MTLRAAAPMFQGPLGHEFEAFLAYRRDLATAHAHVLVVLRHLDRFLVEHAPEAHTLTRRLVQEWMATLTGRAAITRRNYFRIVRQFCVFRARADPAAFIPDTVMGPRVTAASVATSTPTGDPRAADRGRTPRRRVAASHVRHAAPRPLHHGRAHR